MSKVPHLYEWVEKRTVFAAVIGVSSALLYACAGSPPPPPSPEPETPTPIPDTEPSMSESELEAEVARYIEAFPYQESYNYMMTYTEGDASRINTWVVGATPALVEAGADKVVRMNNDTFYKMAFVMPTDAPVILSSTAASKDRFYSFQLMDDRNVNFKNVLRPAGRYALYRGTPPADFDGELIEVPSDLGAVIVRVEVKNKADKKDSAKATKIFEGITIEGPAVSEIPRVDRLSSFNDAVAETAMRRITEASENTPFRDLVPRIGQTVGTDISFLNLAAAAMSGWGSPDPHHSAYDIIYIDATGKELVGTEGPYTLTTPSPPAKAFWSVTVYDTDRGGYFHPNPDNRYHLNNTTAKKNKDGTVTFLFKTKCEKKDKNCLAVPEGRWDMTARYYEPEDSIINGEWQMSRPAKSDAPASSTSEADAGNNTP